MVNRARLVSSLRKSVTLSPAAHKHLLEQLNHTDHEIEYETTLHGESSWQVRALTFLHSPAVELTLMGLLIFDIFILFADAYMEPEHPDCYHVRANAVCEDGSEATCVEHEEPPIASVADALSLAITCVFMVENMTLLIILGFRDFFGNVFYAVDFIVVATSLGLEAAFLMLGEDDLARLAGLLVLARLWRFVRLGHGLISATIKKEQKTIEGLKDHIEVMESLLKRHGLEVPREPQSAHDVDYFALT